MKNASVPPDKKQMSHWTTLNLPSFQVRLQNDNQI